MQVTDPIEEMDAEALRHQLEEASAALRHREAEIARHEATIAAQRTEIGQLQEQLNVILSRRYAQSAEKVSDAQLGLFNEAEETHEEGTEDNDAVDEDENDTGTEVAAHVRRRGKRKPLPAHLERVDIEHELPEAERTCPQHDVALERFGEEVCEQLDIVPAKIRVLRHIRGKYRCPCCEGHLVTAPLAPQPIPKSMASPGLLAHIAVAKFCDALPLYRQTTQFGRIGVEFSRTTLAAWMVKMGQQVQPLINLLRERLLERGYILMDETRVQVLAEAGKPAESQSFLWAQRTVGMNPIVLFDYDPTRSSAVPMRLLEGFSGTLHTDGYRGYDGVVEQHNLTRLYCFAHARRKFIEVIKGAGINPKKIPNKPPPAVRAALKPINFIKTLYTIERRIQDLPPDERYRQRQRDSVAVLAKLRAWLDERLKRVLPSGKMGQAITYLDKHWSGLIGYVEHGRYRIDTNLIENAIRPFCLGRKNWMFSQSVAGAKASANLYSLIETAKANGVEPYAYLRHVFTELPKANTVDDIEALLPGHIDLAAITLA